MKPIKILLLSVTVLFCSLSAFAQSSSTNQLGLRIGGFSGFNFRHITDNNFGIDISIMGNVPHDWTLFSLLAEKHFPLNQGFVIYAGAGGYFAYSYDFIHKENLVAVQAQLGLEGIIGLDYYIPNTPINIGDDLLPRFYFLVFPYPWDGGLSFRYIF